LREVGCVIFGMKHRKGQKNPRGIGVSKAGMMLWFEGFQTDIHPEKYMDALS
jgi:hypothetical protein